MRFWTLGLACAVIAAAAPNTEPTFYKDVLPVLQKNCQSCHRPGEAAPMSFMSFDSTRPWAKAIKTAVSTHKMPPWFADPHIGKFSNDRTLSDADVQTIVSWVDAGAKAGNAKDAPAPVKFVEGWVIGKPDAVFEVPTAFEVPKSGTIDYQYVIVHTNFTEDKWVQFAEARPSDVEHCHHIIAYLREPGNPWMKDAPIGVAFVPERPSQNQNANAQNGNAQNANRNGGGDGGGGLGDFLAGYAPGMVAPQLKEGQAKLIKAGSDIVFQLHYTANGKPGADKSRVGFIFSKTQPTERIVTLAAQQPRFAIPPGDPNYRVDAKLTLQDDSKLNMLLPHMHLRGKSFEFRVVYPDGTKETLLSVPHYSFSWQLSYFLQEQKVLPKGTTVEVTGWFDNSANNPYNPDPTKEVHFGEQSWDEMMFGFFDVAVPLDKGAMDLMRPKQPARKATGAVLE
jgi:hypothetical protein